MLIIDTVEQIEASIQCINSGDYISVISSGMLHTEDKKHTFCMIFSCGCCDARIMEFHNEKPHETLLDRTNCDCNVMAVLRINFGDLIIGVYELDGTPLENLAMTAEVIMEENREGAIKAREQIIKVLDESAVQITKACANRQIAEEEGYDNNEAPPPSPIDNKDIEEVSENLKDHILSITMDGCQFCGCHKGNAVDRLIASAGVLTYREHDVCECDCSCCYVQSSEQPE